jgi:hypothetical protein
MGNRKVLQLGARVFYLLAAAMVVAGVALTGFTTSSQAVPPQMVTLCHASGLDGTTKFETLTIAYPAAYGNGGHFNEDGTPKAGHENDYLGPCREATATETATVTQTATVTETQTETATATPDPEDTKVGICHYEVAQGGKYSSLDISINSVASAADWLNGHGGHENDIWPSFYAKNGDLVDAYGDQSVLQNGCEVAETETPTETVTLTETETATETVTVTPTEVVKKSTPVPTLQIPVTGGENILIPVTGVDQVNLVGKGAGSTKSQLFFNMGLVFAGFGLVLQGFSKRK